MDNVETTPLDMVQPTVTITMIQAVEEVIRKAGFHEGLAIGIKESMRAIENGEAYLCVLAGNCDRKEYRELVEKMCTTSKIDLIVVPDKKNLGLWAGLDKKTLNLKTRKKHNCSCLVVKNFGEDSAAVQLLLREFEKHEDGEKVIRIEGEKKEEEDEKKKKKKKD